MHTFISFSKMKFQAEIYKEHFGAEPGGKKKKSFREKTLQASKNLSLMSSCYFG